MERELAAWRLWLKIGKDAMKRFRIRHPHALPRFGQYVRLMEIAFDFGRLAVGEHSPQAQPEPGAHTSALADLKRIYGDRDHPP